MTIAQVEKFIKESIENSYKWERIRLLGGEPTLHPEILLILDLMSKYRRDHSPETIIQLVTNGFGSSSEILRKVPQNIEVCNSKKKSRNQLFSSFNLAPVDKKNYKPGNYEKGCINFSECGIGLNRYGYYCCGNAAGIDRVFGFDFGRKKLPLPDDQFEDQLKTFCKLCGIFASFRLTKRELISASWQKAYRRYSEKRPQLKLY